MELVAFGKEVLQNIAEQAASYRLGQSALRHLDRALWVVEKCARWAVPPPLDQDERPQPELVRPLPWVFFLALLIALRVTREGISLVNLVMGKPPLRSADVVMYIQSKRRYLRTLKYQGSRMMRARATPAQPPRAWYTRVRSLLEFAMCARSRAYGNNNTTHVSNNDEVLIVKRSKRSRQPQSPAAAPSDTSMERLIERMMQDLDADSDDDSSYTLTNVTSIRSDPSDTAESDQDTVHSDTSPSKSTLSDTRTSVEMTFSPNKSSVSTPEKDSNTEQNASISTPEKDSNVEQYASNEDSLMQRTSNVEQNEDTVVLNAEKTLSTPKEETKLFLQTEKCKSPNEARTANGGVANAPGKKRGLNSERRDSGASEEKHKSPDKTM